MDSIFVIEHSVCKIVDDSDYIPITENKIEDEDLIKFFLREYFDKEDVSQEYKDVKHLMKFEDALWFYWAKCRYLDTGKESFLAIMKDKQEAYLK